MTGFLNSLKADLLDRRVLPILLALGVALVAALAYAALGGGGSTPAAPSASAPATSAATSGITVSETKVSGTKSVVETTNGSSTQHAETSRNPFAPLHEASSKAASAAPSTSSSSSSSSTSSTPASSQTGTEKTEPSSPAKGTGESSPSPSKKPSSPAKQKTVYKVSVRFGTAPAGTPPLSAPLTPYENLTRQQPLPSSAQPLVVFRGVIAGGKSATFTLVGEAILRGTAACLPSASQCQAIDVKVGETEELEYNPPGGTAVVYELQVVSIDSTKASAAKADLDFQGESKSGMEVLKHADLPALPGLRYSATNGVLVFTASDKRVAVTPASVWGARPKL